MHFYVASTLILNFYFWSRFHPTAPGQTDVELLRQQDSVIAHLCTGVFLSPFPILICTVFVAECKSQCKRCAMLSFYLSVDSSEYRSIDGTGNNIDNPTWGSSKSPFSRIQVQPDGYISNTEDGMICMVRPHLLHLFHPLHLLRTSHSSASRPNPRTISNTIMRTTGRGHTLNKRQANQLHIYWGLLLTRDLMLTAPGTEAAPIPANGTEERLRVKSEERRGERKGRGGGGRRVRVRVRGEGRRWVNAKEG